MLCSCMPETRRSCLPSGLQTGPPWSDSLHYVNTSLMLGTSIASRSGQTFGAKDTAPVFSAMLKLGFGGKTFDSCRSRPLQKRARIHTTNKRERFIAGVDSRRLRYSQPFGMLIIPRYSPSRSCMRANPSLNADVPRAGAARRAAGRRLASVRYAAIRGGRRPRSAKAEHSPRCRLARLRPATLTRARTRLPLRRWLTVIRDDL